MKDFTRLDNLIKGFVEKGSVPGCSVAVMQNDELLFHSEAGFQNIEAKTLITVNSMFAQASMTKLFAYAIMAMLYEEGKFLFSDPLSDYLPEWKDTKKYVTLSNGQTVVEPLEHPITIRNAVAMMCGLPYCMVPAVDPVNPTLAAMSKEIAKIQEGGIHTALRDEVRVIANAPVMFEPGSHWQYGFGSEITGALIQEMTGKPLKHVFDERIIKPLGLKHTDTYITDENREFAVTTYAKKENGDFSPVPGYLWSDPEEFPLEYRPNLYSSSADMAVFMQMLANGGTYKGEKFLGEGTVAMMHADQQDEISILDFERDAYPYNLGYGYGLGFRTLKTQKYGHNGHLGSFGWTGGWGTWTEADPVAKCSVVYMHNMLPNQEVYHHHRVRAVAYGCLF